MSKLTHVDDDNRPHMVDISHKPSTPREALARGKVIMSKKTAKLLTADRLPKSAAVETARIAGIMAAKRTSELIPLTHPIPLTAVEINIEVTDNAALIEARTRTHAPTGVEMEAFTAVAVTALTLYDMIKAVDRGAQITDIELIEKKGGKSGHWKRK